MKIKHLEVKRAYYADPENVVVESAGPLHSWAATDPEANKWRNDWQWRIKPKTIRIGEIDVPEPVRAAPEVGCKYFYVALSAPECYYSTSWSSDKSDNRLLSLGLIHLTREAVELHAKALILVSGGTTDGID